MAGIHHGTDSSEKFGRAIDGEVQAQITKWRGQGKSKIEKKEKAEEMKRRAAVSEAARLKSRGAELRDKQKFKEALECYEESVKILKETVGEKDLEYADALEGMGLVLVRMRKREEAKKLEERSLGIIEQNVGRKHPRYADSLDEVGKVLREMGEYQAAL